MKYNQLTILETINHNNRWMFKTQCDCGKIEIKRKDWVLSGRTTSCKSCASKRTSLNYPPPIHRTGCSGLSGTHYYSIKFSAKKRNLAFNVSPEYLWELYTSQNGKCALTGIDIVLSNDIKDNNVNWDVVTASLDRIDSSVGYVPSNVWWVHKEANRLKNNYSLSELVKWCQLIVEKHGNPEPSSVNEIKVAEKVQRLGSEDSTNKLPTSAQPQKILGEEIV